MVISVEITKGQQAKLKRVFKLRGSYKACTNATGIAQSTLKRLEETRRATNETIETLSAYLGYDLELEQDKIPA